MKLSRTQLAVLIEKALPLVENDFVAEMECNMAFGRDFSKAESLEMAKLLAKVYSILHTIHCEACFCRMFNKKTCKTKKQNPQRGSGSRLTRRYTRRT